MNFPDRKKLTLTIAILFIFPAFIFANIHYTADPDTTDIYKEIILERVTVIGAPVWMNKIPGAASYVSTEQLQKQSYTDIHRILRGVSGVNIQEEDGFGLRPNIGLRGAGVERSSKVNLMEDGILIAPAPYSAPAAYYFPNMARMNAVEVRKGSSQIKYGPNTTGGAINMISTPIPSEFSANAELRLGERNSNKFYGNVGNTYKNFGYLAEVLHMNDDGFKHLDDGGNTGFGITDIMTKFMVRTNPDAAVYQRLDLKFGYNDQLSDETYLGLSRNDFSDSPYRRYAASQVDQMDTEHFQLMARHFAMFSEHIDLTTTVYRNDFSRDWYKLHNLNPAVFNGETGNIGSVLNNADTNPIAMNILRGQTSPDDALTVRSNSREYISQGVETILGLSFDTGRFNNELEFGVRLHYDEEDRFQYEDDYRMQDGVMILTTAGIPGTQANRVGSATALSLFIQDEFRTNRWVITPGLRFESISFKNENFGSEDLDRTGSNLSLNEYTITEFIPGIGAAFSATDQLTFIGGIHRGFSPPSPGSSSETKSEQSVNYELGFRYADQLIQTEIIGFYNDYSNLLGSDLAAGGGGGTTAQFNAGKVRVLGLELTTNIDFADLAGFSNVSLPFNLNYTFTDATFRTDFESSFSPWGSVHTGDEIPFIPKHQLNSGLSIDYKNFSTNLNTVYSPQMRTRAGSGSIERAFSTDSYFLVDAGSSYQISSGVNVFLNIRNVLDNTYIVSDRPFGVRPGLPRTVMGGLKLRL